MYQTFNHDKLVKVKVKANNTNSEISEYLRLQYISNIKDYYYLSQITKSKQFIQKKYTHNTNY